jgi:glutamine amidotransferase
MSDDVVIIDYGSGNIRSIFNALKRCARDDQNIIISNEATAIETAERLVLPGVGAFAECMRKLNVSALLPSIKQTVTNKRPILGICVGMQVLADEGREFETSIGLGLIGGAVRRIEFPNDFSGVRKLPHVGWTKIKPKENPLFEDISENEHFYFAHSYIFETNDVDDIAATANYGEEFAVAVCRNNIFGCQFHPEKSDRVGLRLMENFCRWKP